MLTWVVLFLMKIKKIKNWNLCTPRIIFSIHEMMTPTVSVKNLNITIGKMKQSMSTQNWTLQKVQILRRKALYKDNSKKYNSHTLT